MTTPSAAAPTSAPKSASDTFDIKQYSELKNTMPKEEYMKFVMNKFLESKRQAKMKVLRAERLSSLLKKS
jgi:hypothetical protein